MCSKKQTENKNIQIVATEKKVFTKVKFFNGDRELS